MLLLATLDSCFFSIDMNYYFSISIDGISQMKLVFNDVILPVISVVLFLYAAATCHMVVCKQYGLKQEISKPIQVCKSSNLSQFYDSSREKPEILFLFFYIYLMHA